MKKLFIFSLSLFAIPAALLAQLPATLNNEPIIEERHQLFVLGTLSFLYNRLEVHPKPGWDIAAFIAWDVENVNHTPEFVIGQNQNFEKQGNIFHAEIMAIEKAALKKKSLLIDSSQTLEELHKKQSLRLINATLYSSLEPCPFCMMGITWARIPKVIYFMADPSARSRDTFDSIPLPNEFCGRVLAQMNLSSLSLASKVNQELKDLLPQDPLGNYTIPAGYKDFSCYLKTRQDELLKEGHELFLSYEVVYDQNKDLYNKLVNAIECDSDGKTHR